MRSADPADRRRSSGRRARSREMKAAITEPVSVAGRVQAIVKMVSVGVSDPAVRLQERGRRPCHGDASGQCGAGTKKGESWVGCLEQTVCAAKRASFRSTRHRAPARRGARAGAAPTVTNRSGFSPAATPASPGTGSSASWRSASAAQGGVLDERGHRPDAGGRLSHAADGLHRRRGDLRLAQSVRGQRHQGVLGRRREVHRDAGAAASRRSIADASWTVPAGDAAGGRADRLSGGVHRRTCSRSCPPIAAPDGMRIAIDCANGATTTWRRGCSASSGSRRAASAASPTDATSTCSCGSTAPELLARDGGRGGYELGIAFDGDGDRAIFVDARAAWWTATR